MKWGYLNPSTTKLMIVLTCIFVTWEQRDLLSKKICFIHIPTHSSNVRNRINKSKYLNMSAYFGNRLDLKGKLRLSWKGKRERIGIEIDANVNFFLFQHQYGKPDFQDDFGRKRTRKRSNKYVLLLRDPFGSQCWTVIRYDSDKMGSWGVRWLLHARSHFRVSFGVLDFFLMYLRYWGVSNIKTEVFTYTETSMNLREKEKFKNPLDKET